MSDVATLQQRIAISHRIAAHRMRRRGQSPETIADLLRVSVRSVHRYLSLECPEEVSSEPEVNLEDFFLQGACGGFPEYDWSTKNPSMQAECKAICEYCPVLKKCRNYGLQKGRTESGIWGGLNKSEREREVARQRQRTASRPGVAASLGQEGAA